MQSEGQDCDDNFASEHPVYTLLSLMISSPSSKPKFESRVEEIVDKSTERGERLISRNQWSQTIYMTSVGGIANDTGNLKMRIDPC